MAINIDLTSSDNWLTFKEAMNYLKTSRSTIYRLMWSNRLIGKKLGSNWRFSREALDGCMYDQVITAPPSAQLAS